jgi:hypothetical protein
VIAGRGLAVDRMVELGRVSRASFYRFTENAASDNDADMDLRDVSSSGSLWSGPATGGGGSPGNYTAAAER